MLRKVHLLLVLLFITLLVVPFAAAQDDTFALTVMHTNDTHARHEPDGDGNGGVARQATVVNQIRAEVENSLLLDAGDRFTGTLFHTTYLGQDQVAIMNALGYDAMTLGNHEFDNGDQVLADFVAGLDFPVVTANIDFNASPELANSGITPYVVLDVNGQQVGIIGLTTADTQNIASPGDSLVWSDDYAGVANAAAAELAGVGVNKIILLTHTGINVDNAFVGSLENIDLVVGGHSHTLFSNMTAGAAGEYPLEFTSPLDQPILYVQAGQYNQYLGRIDLEFDADGVLTGWDGDSIFLTRYITPEPLVDQIVADLAVEVNELSNTPIGATTDVFLTGDRSVCRVEECNLGNLIADSMRWETGAQIAIMNGGGVRADIDEGDITLGEVLTVQPFGNTISIFEATGADIIAALENGVSGITLNDAGQVSRGGAPGRFPQVSGLRFSFDPTQEAGSRIVSVEVLMEDGSFAPIDPEATYTVVTNNFVRTGGDGYSMFAENAINPYDFGRTDYEVTAEYMATISPITIGVEGRITIVNAEVEPRQ